MVFSIHGKHNTTEYHIWEGMKQRCHNPNNPRYCNYGGRGIVVCERWKDFQNFYADMGPRPSTDYSIDRIDNDGNYEPSNCRWATSTQQNRNNSHNTMIEYNGKSQCLIEWAEELGISAKYLSHRYARGMRPPEVFETVPWGFRDVEYKGRVQYLATWAKELGIHEETLRARLNRGWSVEKAFETKAERYRELTYEGRTMSVSAWAREIGMEMGTLWNRLKIGWSVEKAITTPVYKKE